MNEYKEKLKGSRLCVYIITTVVIIEAVVLYWVFK